MMDEVIIGYSGHAYSVIDVAISSGYHIKYYTEKNLKDSNPFDLRYLGNEKEADFFNKNSDKSFFIGIGNNQIRKNIAEALDFHKVSVFSIISNQANVSKLAQIESGTFIGKGVNLNALSIVGKAVILNTGCIVEHECTIGSYSHIAPGAVLPGNVSIGNNCFIGANSFVKEGVKIGDNTIIGAGSVVLNDIGENKKFAGNPAREIESSSF